MNCCICGITLNDYGNNPWPLVAEEDLESRCCNYCNNLVIKTRLMGMSLKNGWHDKSNLKVGDNVVIIFSKNSQIPTEMISSGKFLGGTILEITENEAKGDWGNFALNLDDDNYIKKE